MFRKFMKRRNERSQLATLTKEITQCLGTSISIGVAGDARIFAKLRQDDYVLSYMDGAIGISVEVADVKEAERKAYIFRDVYDGCFPGEGRAIVDQCNLWAKQKNKQFLEAATTGYREMAQVFESNGKSLLVSLSDHLGGYLKGP